MEAALQASAPRKQHQPRAAGTEAFVRQEMAHLPDYTLPSRQHTLTHTHTHSTNCSSNKQISHPFEKNTVEGNRFCKVRFDFLFVCSVFFIFSETVYMIKKNRLYFDEWVNILVL